MKYISDGCAETFGEERLRQVLDEAFDLDRNVAAVTLSPVTLSHR
jgi:hypothetical protein